jgi:hypothetical protein
MPKLILCTVNRCISWCCAVSRWISTLNRCLSCTVLFHTRLKWKSVVSYSLGFKPRAQHQVFQLLLVLARPVILASVRISNSYNLFLQFYIPVLYILICPLWTNPSVSLWTHTIYGFKYNCSIMYIHLYITYWYRAWLSRSCSNSCSWSYNGCLVIPRIVRLIAANLKHLMFFTSGSTFFNFAKICVFMILYGLWLLPA